MTFLDQLKEPKVLLIPAIFDLRAIYSESNSGLFNDFCSKKFYVFQMENIFREPKLQSQLDFLDRVHLMQIADACVQKSSGKVLYFSNIKWH